MKKLVYIIQTPPFWVKTPPLALFYLKKHLEKKGISTGIIDLNHTIFNLGLYTPPQWLGLDETFEKNLFFIIEKKFPSILSNLLSEIKDSQFIGFSLFKRNTPFALLLAQKIKQQFPSKKIIFGGPQVLFLDKANKLDPQFSWIIGEGEIPLYQAIQNNANAISRFQEIDTLDTLPFIDFDPINLTDYSHSRSIALITSRGCTHKCAFCTEKNLYQKFRHYSPQYMIDQITYLIKKYQTTHFIFTDSMINYKNTWLEEFCQKIISQRLNIQWEAQIRIKKHFPLDLAKLMKKSGCYNLFIGLESGSDKTLKNMNKGFTTNDALDFFTILTNASLHFEVSLILGYPQESETDFNQTLSFIIKNKRIIPKIAQINPFIDYFADSNDNSTPSKEAINRVQTMINTLKTEKIRYTKRFINNLIY
ncbi:MAG: B12-binding domain-containing radical SAM protein [Candidatus Omnitrophica bacterium]|nr:B12-binding domain-containing radical SAM protein [Candidatus Omnitrophota bacterium]